MSNKKISEFYVITGLTTDSYIPLIQGTPPQNYIISKEDLSREIGGGGGTSTGVTQDYVDNQLELKANQSTEEVYDPWSETNVVADVTWSVYSSNADYANSSDYANGAGNDANGNQIDLTYATKNELGTVETAEDGFYVTDSNGYIGLKFDENGLDSSELSDHFKSLIPSAFDLSFWSGKKIAYLGDSLTEFHKYVDKYTSLTSSTALNYGIGGTCIGSINTGITNSFVARYTEMDNTADMVIVFGGTNDFTNPVPFGTFSDRIVNSFYGALHLLCVVLLTKYPRKPIVFMTPLHRAGTTPEYNQTTKVANTNSWTGKTLKEYVNAIKDVCQYYSIPVLDSYSESGIDVEVNTSYYFTDGLHQTTAGGNKLASYMYPRLEKIYDEYYKNNL